MKLVIVSLVLCVTMLGCKPVTANTSPTALAPGALNQFDQTAYQALSAAHAFALTASKQAATLTPEEKSALNSFITATNAADLIYVAYHSGTATQAQVQSALATVSTNQAAYATAVTSGVK